MSRCFPYTAPVYKVNRAVDDEALIESIKLQEKTKRPLSHDEAERKKELKREKKERKRKEKKEKANLNDKNNMKIEAPHFSHIDKMKKVEAILKERENEELERSNITSEHDQPILISQNSSCSFDSTLSSNKRKRDESSSPPAIVKPELKARHGNVVKIRLSAKKQKVVDASLSTELPEQQNCSTSGRTEIPLTQNIQIAPSVPENVPQTPLLVPDGDKICSTSGKSEAKIEEDTSSWLKIPDKKFRKMELKYKDLVEKWAPLPLIEHGFDDQDWLCRRKNSEIRIEKKVEASVSLRCGGSSTMWPHAQYLPEVDIYALPFTIPF